MIPFRFIDAAHAEFYALGKRGLAGVDANSSLMAATLRCRLLPFMDLSDAHAPCMHLAPMGRRERKALRSGIVALPRFIAWAMEYAEAVDECGAAGSVYDPERLLEVLSS